MLVQERDKPARMRSPHRPGHEPPPQRLPELPQPLGLLTGGAAPQRAVRQYPRRFRPGRDVYGALEEMYPAVLHDHGVQEIDGEPLAYEEELHGNLTAKILIYRLVRQARP